MRQLVLLPLSVLPLTMGCWLVAGCRGDESSDRAELLVYRYSVGGDASMADTAFLMPLDLAVVDSEIAVADAAEPDIRVLSESGEVRRVLGSRGSGPGELKDVRGLAIGPDGSTAVADQANQRVTIFGEDATVRGEIPLRGRVGSLAFDDLGRLHVARRGPVESAGDSGAATTAVYTPQGELVLTYGSYEPQPDPFADAYINEARYAPAGGGGMWVLYPYRGVAELRSEAGELMGRIELPPPKGRPADGPFTRPDPGNPDALMIVRMPVADDIAVDRNGRVYVAVLQIPEDAAIFTELLVYDSDGRPLGAQPLLRRARRIAVQGARLYALRDAQAVSPGIDVYGLGEDGRL